MLAFKRFLSPFQVHLLKSPCFFSIEAMKRNPIVVLPSKQMLHKLQFLQKLGCQKPCWDQARLSSLVNKQVVFRPQTRQSNQCQTFGVKFQTTKPTTIMNIEPFQIPLIIWWKGFEIWSSAINSEDI